MNDELKQLSIITITYNNPEDFYRTSKRIKPLLKYGVSWIVINGGDSLNFNTENNRTIVVEEPDDGIFDALNKGVKHVQTKFFMNVHSGDLLLKSPKEMIEEIKRMELCRADLSLGNQLIPLFGFKRIHASKFWYPFFLIFGCQPPHLPTIYRTKYVAGIKYDTANRVIADFYYFKDIMKTNPLVIKQDGLTIEMGPGGNTTSGFKSYVLVSKEHIKNNGLLKSLPIILFRIPFKIIQMLY